MKKLVINLVFLLIPAGLVVAQTVQEQIDAERQVVTAARTEICNHLVEYTDKLNEYTNKKDTTNRRLIRLDDMEKDGYYSPSDVNWSDISSIQ